MNQPYQSSLTQEQIDDFQKRLVDFYAQGGKGTHPLVEYEQGLHKRPVTDSAINKLVKHTGILDVPIIHNPHMKEDNAYYVYSGGRRTLPEEYRKNKYPNGFIVYSDALKNLPTMAHELGHAKDFTSGEYPLTKARLLRFGIPATALLAAAGFLTAVGTAQFSKSKHAPLVIAASTGVGVTSLLASLIMGNKYGTITRDSEVRATNNAKKWMKELYKKKDLQRYSNALDYALLTYGVPQVPTLAKAASWKGPSIGAAAGAGFYLAKRKLRDAAYPEDMKKR